MKAPHRVFVLATVTAFMAGTAVVPAAAQSSAQPFEALQGTLPQGTAVTVLDQSGKRRKGVISGLSDTSITLDTKGVMPQRFTFDREDILTLRKTDSNKDGFWIGFAAGLVPGLMLAHGVNQYCYNETPDHCPGAYAIIGAITGLTGGWIGASIDGAITGGPILFSQPKAPRGARIRPFATPDGKSGGVALTLGF